MKTLSICAMLVCVLSCEAFTTSSLSHKTSSAQSQGSHLFLTSDESSNQEMQSQPSRRNVLASMASATLGVMTFQQPALAIPMATVDEFAVILRDSPLSVNVVEFSGPRSENVVVKLVDGTTFGIKDIVESSTDPRSPLKLSAACRESGVKTKFVDLEAMLASSPKKKKLYTNQRVQEAQQKEKDRLERIQKDEEERLAELAKIERETSGN